MGDKFDLNCDEKHMPKLIVTEKTRKAIALEGTHGRRASMIALARLAREEGNNKSINNKSLFNKALNMLKGLFR